MLLDPGSVQKFLSDLDWTKSLDDIVASIAIMGSIVSLTKTLSGHSQRRSSLLARRNQELDRAGELAGLYARIAQTALPGRQMQLLQEGIHARLKECVSLIEDLDLKLAKNETDPNWQLSTWKQFCLWFPFLGWREVLLHLLTYSFLVATLCFGAMTIKQYWVNVRQAAKHTGPAAPTGVSPSSPLISAPSTPPPPPSAEPQPGPTFFTSPHPVVTFIFLVFTLIFHRSCLDERRREMGYRRELGPVTRLFLIQAPETGRMLAAQLLFYISATLTLTLLVMLGRNLWKSDEDAAMEALGTVVAYIYTSIFHGWATAEYDYWRQNRLQMISSFYVMFKGFFRNFKQTAWVKVKLIFASVLTACVGILALWLILFSGDFGDVLFAAAIGSLFVLITLYPASRTVRIRYALAEKSSLAAAASSSR